VVVGGLVQVSSFLARLGHFVVVAAVVVSRFPGGAVLQIKRKIYNLIRIKKTWLYVQGWTWQVGNCFFVYALKLVPNINA